jgi:hypothetical protein
VRVAGGHPGDWRRKKGGSGRGAGHRGSPLGDGSNAVHEDLAVEVAG